MYRYAVNELLVEELKRLGPPKPGTVHFQLQNGPINVGFSYYELNWLFVRAFRTAQWYVHDTTKLATDTSGPNELYMSTKQYRTKYVMRDYKYMCHTEYRLDLEAYTVISALEFDTGVGRLPDVSLTKLEEVCS